VALPVEVVVTDMTITLHWPQIFMLAWYALGMGLAIRDHGRIDPKPENAWHQFIALAIVIVVLYFGGFWS
jgi:hypothetical protein